MFCALLLVSCVVLVLCLFVDAMLDDPRLEGVPAVDISDAALVASQGC